MQRSEDTLKALKKQTPSPQLTIDIARLEKELELYKQEKRCYEAQILTVCLNFVKACFNVHLVEFTCVCTHASAVCIKWSWYLLTPTD